MTNRKIEYWVIPPQADAEFVAGMEAVLDLSEKPYGTRFPVMAMDEQPLQLLKETRQPVSATRHHPKRIEYERAGESVSVLRTFGRLAAGDGTAAAEEGRLGSRGRRPAAGALCEGGESDPGLRQLEHGHAGRFTKPSMRPRPDRWYAAWSSATCRSMAVG